MKNKTMLAVLSGAALLGGAAAGLTAVASAQTTSGTTTATQAPIDHRFGPGIGGRMMWRGRGMMKNRGVNGTVTAVNGNTITVTAKNGTSYTVDATNAKLAKVITISASDVKVGDTIDARGAVSGSTVNATRIVDGLKFGQAE